MLTRLNALPPLAPDDILLVACLRNEMLRLPWFLHYYRRLGIDRFLIVDNGSDDGSRAFILEQEDVTVFHTEQSYADSGCGIDWQNALLRDHAVGHWTFVVDVDEIFVFPGCEATGLRRFLTYLDGKKATAVVAPMIDMYPGGAIAEAGYRAGQDPLEVAPFFDVEGYQLGGARSEARGLPVRGGPRHRLFWEGRGRDFPSPVLRKTPLLRWSATSELIASTHKVKGCSWAEVSGVLLHFKLLQDFAASAREETARAQHFADARQYRAYDEVISKREALTAYYEGSVRFRNTEQLCQLGLMRVPPAYSLLGNGVL
ncbi:glycosyltransferase family 2 protein [Roseovarius aestuariivivens]|uniref:glycosyltransferase family 2 protein n=1 Tax=Roseovarius aestuariivivens TaxID=1888910 RepID=UPI0014368710|nr:glycosyltransferase family 2 protein [Roseovarius aestuariivivens]